MLSNARAVFVVVTNEFGFYFLIFQSSHAMMMQLEQGPPPTPLYRPSFPQPTQIFSSSTTIASIILSSSFLANLNPIQNDINLVTVPIQAQPVVIVKKT